MCFSSGSINSAGGDGSAVILLGSDSIDSYETL